MNLKKNITGNAIFALLACIALGSCQKMDRPALGNYLKDANAPGGPLKFYAAFDGATTDPLMNAVDSVRANFPSDNPLSSIEGVSGKAISGTNKKFLKYTKPNDWAIEAKSFTVSFWMKRNGQTQNNAGTNGPEYIFSLKSNSGHWSGSNMLVFIEGNNTACAIKVMIADKTKSDNWFTWENANAIPGLLNNAWHHIALTYDAASSKMTLYVDGVANPNTRTWGTHGNINIDNATITEFRVGAGPNTKYDTDDWLSSTFKGQLDQLRLYSAALPASEISSLYSKKL